MSCEINRSQHQHSTQKKKKNPCDYSPRKDQQVVAFEAKDDCMEKQCMKRMWFYWYWKCLKWTTRRGGSVLKIWVVISLMKPILNQEIPVVTKTYVRLIYQYVRIKGIWETNQGSPWNLCLPLYLVNVYILIILTNYQ